MRRRLIFGFLFVVFLGAGGFGVWKWRETQTGGDIAGRFESAMAEGDLLTAWATAAELRGLAPQDPVGWLYCGRVAILRADETNALDCLERAYRLMPGAFPMIPEREMLRSRLARNNREIFEELDILDQYSKRFTDSAGQVYHARMWLCAFLLSQPTIKPEERERATALAEKLLAVPPPDIAGTPWHFDRARLLLATGHPDEALAAARDGIAADTDPWMVIQLEWAAASRLMHTGKDEEAWGMLQDVAKRLRSWKGTHFGMGMPLVDWVQLTAQVRFGRTLELPDREAVLEHLSGQGVTVPKQAIEIRQLVHDLNEARASGQNRDARTTIDTLLEKVATHSDNPLEDEWILGNVHTMLRVAQGDLLLKEGDTVGARAAYESAKLDWPDDPWIEMKLLDVVRAESGGEELDPVRLLNRDR